MFGQKDSLQTEAKLQLCTDSAKRASEVLHFLQKFVDTAAKGLPIASNHRFKPAKNCKKTTRRVQQQASFGTIAAYAYSLLR